MPSCSNVTCCREKSYKSTCGQASSWTSGQMRTSSPPPFLPSPQLVSQVSSRDLLYLYTQTHSTLCSFKKISPWPLLWSPKGSFAIQVTQVLVLLLSPQTQHQLIPTELPHLKAKSDQSRNAAEFLNNRSSTHNKNGCSNHCHSWAHLKNLNNKKWQGQACHLLYLSAGPGLLCTFLSCSLTGLVKNVQSN